MTKVAVYGFIRIVFDLIGVPQWWWSLLMLALGGVTAAMGILYAMLQTDLKRLLAYSTVENIGVIFVGLGLALAFKASGMPAAAALAMTAALFPCPQPLAVQEPALPSAPAAVLNATGLRDPGAAGGLIGRMPQTAFVFLVGAVAISALPPLNGFVSEWLTFQAILLSPDLPQWALKILVPGVGALLALAAALAAALPSCGHSASASLGRTRSTAAAVAVETDRFSLAAMFILAGLCLAAGLFPRARSSIRSHRWCGRSLAPTCRRRFATPLALHRAGPPPAAAPITGLLVFIFIALSASLAGYSIHRLASRAVRRGPAWDGGFPNADPATQYTAGSFAQPIRRVFGATLFLAREHVEMPPPGSLAPRASASISTTSPGNGSTCR